VQALSWYSSTLTAVMTPVTGTVLYDWIAANTIVSVNIAATVIASPTVAVFCVLMFVR